MDKHSRGDDQQITIRALEAGDAVALTHCFRRCYGDTYPAADLYDPVAIRRRVGDATLRGVVAVTPAGEIVGHTALSVRDQHARVPEAGNTVVDPAYRRRGLLRELGLALAQRCLAEGFSGFVHYPTTAHEMMQRASVESGGIETGVMLAYVAADAEYVGIEEELPTGRLAATIVYQPLGALPHRDVTVPERYRVLLEELFAKLGAERTLRSGQHPAGRSSLRTAHSMREGIVRHAVDAIGTDFDEDVIPLIARPAAPLTLVDLPLGDPAIDRAVEALTQSGFFYSGLLPEFAGGDVLRLQRLSDLTPDAYHPMLANADARRLLEYIDADRADQDGFRM